jgi:predicted ATPase/class 3 adenylate cyclase
VQRPAGIVTFLFTDIEGSTRLLHELVPELYAEALAEHRRALRECFVRHGGVEVDTQGDAFFVAFADAPEAVACADDARRALAGGPISVRMGLHTGRPRPTEEGYVGEDVHLAARIAASGHGEQVLLSAATRDALGPSNTVLLSELGEHRLKDFEVAVPIFQLGSERFAPLKTISNTNLPRPASSLIGRDTEVAEVVALMRASRLVTLTGPGGTGKTRLAIEAAAELVGDFKAGVFWIPLATVRDSALVFETIARTLGAQGDLAEHLGERELLLLLDNFEQVVDAAPELSSLLRACANLRLLVTSRELLRIDGEAEYAVPPLASAEAVELFCDRSGLEPSDSVGELCRRLDDMPLAVELAAARVAVLSPEQILDRLSDRFDLLKGGRDADPRQQTLRATIEWSYELLSEDEQGLFGRLAVFVGGCTLDTAEDVADADLDVLQSLVEKSLVRNTDRRFWMLETIREFAQEQFAVSDDADEIRRRHARRLLAVGESANLSAESEGPERPELVRPELDNFRWAIDRASNEDPDLAFRLAISLEQFWVMNDPYEGSAGSARCSTTVTR